MHNQYFDFGYVKKILSKAVTIRVAENARWGKASNTAYYFICYVIIDTIMMHLDTKRLASVVFDNGIVDSIINLNICILLLPFTYMLQNWP